MELKNTRRGFTLIELIVAVLIIAVLAAVAVPQYKKSVLKSRFTTVMPMAKAVADAQEVYFLANGQYSLDKAYLDITPMNVENTEVELSTAAEDENYNYVAAKRTDYPNARYIIYQKHSPKFAGNIHCEAKADDTEALWLCEKGLGGVEVPSGGSLQGDDYKTYLLTGTIGNTDNFAKSCTGSASPDIHAAKSGATGISTCVDGEWKYVWSDGNEYEGRVCGGWGAYECAGATFYNGGNCAGREQKACTGSSFRNGGYCDSYNEQGCAGAKFYGGSYCNPYTNGGCEGAIYLPDENGILGCCRAVNTYSCPEGSPVCAPNGTTWNGKCWKKIINTMGERECEGEYAQYVQFVQ